jgi:hypothetical protein
MNGITTFNDYKKFKKFCFEQTGSNPCEPGISLTLRNQTAILRSNDGTEHYPDDLSDINSPKYTLFGPSGDQSIGGRYNATLLNPNKIRHVFLYRVIKNKSKKQYLWYGKYNITGKTKKNHVGLNGNPRKVILLQLERILATVEDFPVVNGLVDFDNESTSGETMLDSDEEISTQIDSDEDFDEDFGENFEEEIDLQKILDVCSKINSDMLELNNSLRK